MTNEENNKYADLVKSYSSRMAEDCPGAEVAIQVLVSYLNPAGDTVDVMKGSGNWYARVGMCQQFIDRDRVDTDARFRPASSDDGEAA